MNPSHLCQYVWESRPIKCKLKRLKYRYKVHFKNGTNDKEKEDHDLDSSTTFENFNPSKSHFGNIDSDTGMIVQKIFALDDYQNTLRSACVIFNRNFEKVHHGNLLKVGRALEEFVKSPILDKRQAVAVVMFISYTRDRQAYQPFFESLESSDSLDEIQLLANFMNTLTTIEQLQQITTLLLSCVPLRENVRIISPVFDNQLEHWFQQCHSFSQLEQCVNVMHQVHQNHDVKIMQKSVVALQKKVKEFIKKSETSNTEVDIGILQRVIDETYHCKPFFSDLLNCIVTSTEQKIWKVSTFVLKHERLHQFMEERNEFIRKWLYAAICFENEENRILNAYKCLQILLDTAFVKEHKLVSYCKDLIRDLSSKHDIPEIIFASGKIKNCVTIFLDHAKHIIHEKTNRSMQEGKALMTLVEPLLTPIRQSGVRHIIVNQRYVEC